MDDSTGKASFARFPQQSRFRQINVDKRVIQVLIIVRFAGGRFPTGWRLRAGRRARRAWTEGPSYFDFWLGHKIYIQVLHTSISLRPYSCASRRN